MTTQSLPQPEYSRNMRLIGHRVSQGFFHHRRTYFSVHWRRFSSLHCAHLLFNRRGHFLALPEGITYPRYLIKKVEP